MVIRAARSEIFERAPSPGHHRRSSTFTEWPTALGKYNGLSETYYNIFISDRVVFSKNFTGAQVTALLAANGLSGVSGGRYFTNAINTRTQGADFVANYGLQLGAVGFVRLTGAYNVTETKVTYVKPTPAALNTKKEALFGRVERGRIELDQPRSNVMFSANLTRRALDVTVRAQLRVQCTRV